MEHGAVSKAAAQVGISRQALHRWIKEPEFAQELHQASSNIVLEASRRLAFLMMQAVDELEKMLNSDVPRDKIRAAELILSHALRLRELTDIEERITALERSIKDG
jgi:hypothetical protein